MNPAPLKSPATLSAHAVEALIFDALPGGSSADSNSIRADLLARFPGRKMDARALIRFAVPKGAECDPQRVADKIREFYGLMP